MKTVQIVLDEDLLAEVDSVARKRRSSRSAFIRESVAQTLAALRMRSLVEAERRAYRQHPQSADERAAFRGLSAAQDRVLAGLGKKDRW
jgi:metal-responsive CopG/Arc/MetJ family transcriptional regulator